GLRLRRRRRARHRRRPRRRHAFGRGAVGLPPAPRRPPDLGGGRDGRGAGRPARSGGLAVSIDGVHGDAAGFIDKWRARWPEWEIASVFVPEAQRPLAEAWFSLLQELTDAAWGGADPTPGLAKLAWWQE